MSVMIIDAIDLETVRGGVDVPPGVQATACVAGTASAAILAGNRGQPYAPLPPSVRMAKAVIGGTFGYFLNPACNPGLYTSVGHRLMNPPPR